nr:uncharacterized protein LOC112019757 [Quercus suber]POF16225.1 hypothetical protein CFP56_47841 [Quercus suber]
MKKETQPSEKSSSHLTSASFTPSLHHRHTDCRSRTISKKIEFSPSPLGCVVLCLPKPPPHHTPELTATEFAGAVRGAWKQTGAAVSHAPKAGALEKIVNASQLEIIELQHSVGELRYQTRRNHSSRGGNLTQLGKVGASLVVRKMANKCLARTKIMLPSLLSLLINQ